jgi:hypothetical protein
MVQRRDDLSTRYVVKYFLLLIIYYFKLIKEERSGLDLDHF